MKYCYSTYKNMNIHIYIMYVHEYNINIFKTFIIFELINLY